MRRGGRPSELIALYIQSEGYQDIAFHQLGLRGRPQDSQDQLFYVRCGEEEMRAGPSTR